MCETQMLIYSNCRIKDFDLHKKSLMCTFSATFSSTTSFSNLRLDKGNTLNTFTTCLHKKIDIKNESQMTSESISDLKNDIIVWTIERWFYFRYKIS